MSSECGAAFIARALLKGEHVMPCSLRMYNQLVEKCFNDCVESFRRKNLDSAEEKVSPWALDGVPTALAACAAAALPSSTHHPC